MKTKIAQSIPAILALLAIGFRYFSNWCIDSISSCYGSWFHQIYQYFTSSLYLFALYFLPIAIILTFVPREIFKSWLKLAVWALPLLLILVATQPINAAHILSTNRDDAARLAGIVFSVVSLAIILYKYFSLRRNSV